MEPKIIILEDITPDEFVMEKGPQSYDTVLKVLKKLAKFHALSFYMNDNHDELIANYTEGFMSERMKGNAAFVQQMMGLAIAVIKDWSKEMEQVAGRLAALMPTMFSRMIKVYGPGTGYNVLNHGDFHLRNIMFKWMDGPEKSANDIRFVSGENNFKKVCFLINNSIFQIDFQFCFYGSPAVDLFWALYFVSDQETRDNHREELIKLYHEEFVAVLKKLGFLKTPPGLLELNVELLKNGGLEAFAALGPLPMFFADMEQVAAATQGGAPTVEMLLEMGKMLLEQPHIKSVIMKLLPKLLYQGCLDLE